MISGVTVAQAIKIGLTPVVARLFLPEDFGVAAMFQSFVLILGPVATLAYAQAIILPKEEAEARGLVKLSVTVLLFCSLLVFAVLVCLVPFIKGLSWVSDLGGWIYVVPVGLALLGGTRILTFWGIRRRKFKTLAKSEVIKTSSTVGMRIGIGALFGSSAGGLIIGVMSGLLSMLGALSPCVTAHDFKEIWKTKIDQVICLAKSYKDFPLLCCPTGFLDGLSGNLPVLMLGFMFPIHVVGFYALANRLLRMPIIFISDSIKKIYFQKCAELRNRGQGLGRPLLRVFLSLFGVGLLPFSVIFAFGEPIFRFFLGEDWGGAGHYASLLAPAVFTIYLLAPFSSTFIVLRRQALWLRLQTLITFSTASGFIVCAWKQVGPEQTLIVFSTIQVLVGIGIICKTFRMTRAVNI